MPQEKLKLPLIAIVAFWLIVGVDVIAAGWVAVRAIRDLVGQF